MKNIFVIPALCIPLSFSFIQKASAQQFIEISADNVILAGSYNDNSFFNTGNEIILVPKISPGYGIGIKYGKRWTKFALDVGYTYSRAEYACLYKGFSGISSTHLIRLFGIKWYLGQPEERKLKPYLDFDWSLAFSHFGKIAYQNSSPTEMMSANYSGMAFGFGAGLEYELNKAFAFNIRVLPEFHFGTDIKSKNGTRYEIQKFSNFLLVNSIGIKYYFGNKK